MVNPVLDYSKLETWQTIDEYKACLRLSREETGRYNVLAVGISQKVSQLIQKLEIRAQFFFKCEQLGLKGQKIVEVFINDCNRNYTALINLVLTSHPSTVNSTNTCEKKIKANL